MEFVIVFIALALVEAAWFAVARKRNRRERYERMNADLKGWLNSDRGRYER